jgi:hypothetical protein
VIDQTRGDRALPSNAAHVRIMFMERPLMADCFEKVLSSVRTDFLRAADALGVLGGGGTASLERIHPVAFSKTLRGRIASRSRPSARFCANFAEAAFSTFSTQSAQSGRWQVSTKGRPPSAFEVLKLMINSSLFGNSTARSTGLAPLRIFTT